MMSNKEKIQIELEVPSKTLHVEHASCPNGHSFADESIKINGKPSLKVKVSYKGKEGFMYLDPIYGSYNNIEEGISIPKGAVIEFYCPECGVNLKEPDDTCQLCASPMFIFHLPNGGLVEGCLKKGCMFHKMKIVDAEQQVSRLFTDQSLDSYL